VADAAMKGDRGAVRALLKQGADVSAAKGDGMTALHFAAERGDVAMTEMLVYAGANVAAVTRIGQYTPLHLASRAGDGPAVPALQRKGLDAAEPRGQRPTRRRVQAASEGSRKLSASGKTPPPEEAPAGGRGGRGGRGGNPEDTGANAANSFNPEEINPPVSNK